MRSELRKRGRRDEQKRSWSLLGRSDGGKRSELSWRRGRKRERDGHEEGKDRETEGGRYDLCETARKRNG